MATKGKRPGSVTQKSVAPSNHWHVRLLHNDEYTHYSWIVCVPVTLEGQKSWESAVRKIKKEHLLPDIACDPDTHELLPGYELQPEIVEWEGSDHMVARLF